MAGLYKTTELIQVQRKVKSLPAFFLQWFNRQINFETDQIAFDKVHTNYQDLAPFVAPNVQGRVMKQEGFNRVAFTPAYVKPKHVIDPNQIIPVQPGEIGNAGEKSLAQRRNAVIADLLVRHKTMHENRWEWMACQALTYGYVDVEGEDYPKLRVNFNRDAALTIVTDWSSANANADGFADIKLARMLANDLSLSGAIVRDWIFGGDAWARFYELHKDELLKLMDKNTRGSETEVTQLWDGLEGVEYIGEIKGLRGQGLIRIWVNTQKYRNEAKQQVYMFPQNAVLGVSSAVDGVRCFGAIMDKGAGYQPLSMFPKMYEEEDPSVEYLLTQGAPLMVPADPNSTVLLLVTLD